MFSRNSLKKGQTIYFIIYREIAFWVKISEILIKSQWEVGEKYQMCCHNHNT